METGTSIYIVGAYDPDTERVQCLQAHDTLAAAQKWFSEVKSIYGVANTFMAGRKLNAPDIGAPIKIKDI